MASSLGSKGDRMLPSWIDELFAKTYGPEMEKTIEQEFESC
jgi:hypothetical protein